jgi:acyl dehydratase
MSENAQKAHAAFQQLIDSEDGPTDWHTITQEQVNGFADATLDHQFIHVDPERAAKTPFGGPVAHGFLTLSLTAGLMSGIKPDPKTIEGLAMVINYGLDKVRFINPVRVGKRVRITRKLQSADLVANDTAVQLKYAMTVHIEDEAKPACVAESLTRFIYS